MNQRIAHIAVVVDDYDEAIAFYTSKLGFTLIEDTVCPRPLYAAPKANSLHLLTIRDICSIEPISLCHGQKKV